MFRVAKALDKIRNQRTRGKVQEIQGKEIEVVWACDEKRGEVSVGRRANESTGEKEERKMVGQREG